MNQVPFLRTSREFPSDIQALTVEINRSYLDIAQAVNTRTIGIYASGSPSVIGDRWYLDNVAYQGLRQVYPITGGGNIPHGINTEQITIFTHIYGAFTDGTSFYPLPYVASPANNDQISLYVDPTNIVITLGGGSPPTISSGYIILEWIAKA